MTTDRDLAKTYKGKDIKTGEWVQAIIQETLCDKGVDVEIWEYNPAKKEGK